MRRWLGVLVALVVLTGCTSWDERQGHVCGDSPDAVCESNEGDVPVLDGPDASGPDEPADGQPDDDAATDCGGTAGADFPDVVDADLEPAGDGTFTVSATLCSAYDTPERYADAWRVLAPSGEVLGVRELLHDHAGEQPFTRSLNEPITLPDGVESVIVEGRDQANGWGGATVEVQVP